MATVEDGVELEKMDVADLGALLRRSDEKIGTRMRAVFFLRSKATEEAAVELCEALKILKGDSSLLRHEIAYCLGQIQMSVAIPALCHVLRDQADCPVVRHESAEALAAIGDVSSTETLDILEEFCGDPRSEVSETCGIAAKRVRWLMDHKKPEAERETEAKSSTKVTTDETQADVSRAEKTDDAESPEFDSIDPAPPSEDLKPFPTKDLIEMLLNTELELFQRYQAMFALRNRGGDEAVLGLAQGLKDPSPLFRHEVAFIFGQMAEPASFPALQASLEDTKEHGMVRHEAAEAIGAIAEAISGDDENASPTVKVKDCVDLLRKYLKDPDPLVFESCETALDALDYWATFGEQ
mmetsp:Transcript_2469/g.4779  ORF Transcript_2469/g.4779 Transcript_2469/m.4779 type:complete len:353 (+) Transcript_2469:113-1171(+)